MSTAISLTFDYDLKTRHKFHYFAIVIKNAHLNAHFTN